MASGRIDRSVILGASALHGMLDIARSFGHRLKRVEIENVAGADARVWLGSRFRDSAIQFGFYDNSEAVSFLPATGDFDADQKSDSGSTSALGTDSTANDGFGVEADEPFDWLVLDIDTLSDGAVTWDIEYWNGTAWTNVTLLEGSLTTLGASTDATGEYLVIIQMPTDWEKPEVGDTPVTDGFTPGRYCMRFRETGSGTTAPLSESIHIGRTRWHHPLLGAGAGFMADEQKAVICDLYDRPVVIFNQAGAHRVTYHSMLISSREILGDPVGVSA